MCDGKVLSSILIFSIASAGCALGAADPAFALTGTSISLAVTSAGNAVTTVPSGTVVTITATVMAGATAATSGQLIFCDLQTTTTCGGLAVFDVAQVHSGVGSICTRLGIGSHKLQVVFVGDNAYSASTSPTQPLVVTGLYGSITGLSATAGTTTGSYNVKAIVTGIDLNSTGTGPTGTVNLVDTSNADNSVAMLSLVAGSSSFGLAFNLVQAASATFYPASVAVADLNGDGIPDVVTADKGSRSVSVLIGNGDGTFQPQRTYAVGNFPSSITIADLNSDGKSDLVVANELDNTVSVLLGNGDGTFQSQQTFATGNGPYFVAVGDFNGDGVPDLAIANFNNNNVSVLLGNGDGTFQTQETYITGASPISIVVGDFNGDGKLDLAVTDSAEMAVSVLLGNGDGTFQPQQFNAVGNGPYSIVDGDFNGDGKRDLAVANFGDNTVSVLLGNGDGTFQAQQIFTTGSAPNSLVVGDFNGDGRLDLAVANSAQNTVSLLLGNGDGTFQTQQLYATGNTPSSVAVGDFNGDGKSDLVVANLSDSTASVLVNISGTTAGVTATGISFPAGTGLHVVSGLYSGDGNYNTSISNMTDLASMPNPAGVSLAVTSSGSVVASVSSGTVVTLTATVMSGIASAASGQVNFCEAQISAVCNGQAVLGTAQVNAGKASLSTRLGIGTHMLEAVYVGDYVYSGATSTVQPLTVTGEYASVTGLSASMGTAVGSYNLTATVTGLDVSSVGTAPTGTVSLLDTSNANSSIASLALVPGSSRFNLGFIAAQSPVVSFLPVAASVSDLNGDGKPDLATADQGSNSVSVLLGNGDGTFQAQQTYAVGNLPSSLAVGDFNNDGKPDLAVVNELDNTVSVLLGNGDGRFQTQQTYSTGNSPSSVIVGDFNGDGSLDLAVANFADNTVSVLFGKGDGTFQTQKTYASGGGPSSITVGDFNGDGKLDLAVANSADNTVSVLLGNGDGTFQAQRAYASGGGPSSITVGDFNGDGKSDLTVANLNDNTVSVLLGNGDGTFQTQETFAAGGAPYSVTVNDLNGDDKADLAVANFNDNTVSLLLGNGDGTFQTQQVYPTGKTPYSVAASDLNGDGKPDLVLAAFNDSVASVLINTSGTTETATATGVSFPAGSRLHLVSANYGGDSNYESSNSSTVSLNSLTITTKLSLSSSPMTSQFGQVITLTANLSPYSTSGFGTDGEVVSFYSGSVSIGTGILASGVATLNISSLPAGSNVLTAGYGGDQSFTASTSGAVTQVVNQAAPTITWATPAAIVYGTALGASQLNASSPVAGSFVYSPAAGTVLSAGSQTLSVTLTPTDTANYTTATAKVTLTVNQAAPTITWATPAAIVYGTALGASQLNASSPVAGSFVYSPAAGTVLSAGSQTLSVTFTPTDTADYTTTMAKATLTVNKATSTNSLVSSANPAFMSNQVIFTSTIASPASTPSGTVSFYDGSTLLGPGTLSSGVATYTTSGLVTGSHSITAVYSGDANFLTVTSTALAEMIEDFTFAPSSGSTSATASPGGQAVYTLAVAPTGGSTLAGTITFSVTGLPTGATAAFSPITVPANSGSTNVTMTVTLSSQAEEQPFERLFKGGVLPVALGFLLLPFAVDWRRTSRRLNGIICLIVLGLAGVGMAIGLAGCGGHGSSSSPQSYSLTIAATSGSLSHSTTVNLTVE